MRKRLNWISIFALMLPLGIMAQAPNSNTPAPSTSQVQIEEQDFKKISHTYERSVSVSLGRAQLSQLEFNSNELFENTNLIKAGYQHFLKHNVSVNTDMGFAFNQEGEQKYFTSSVRGVFHRPIKSDQFMLELGAGAAFSQYQMESVGPKETQSTASWVEGVLSLGTAYRIRPNLTLTSSIEFKHTGFREVELDTVIGSSLMIQPIGLVFHY